MESSFKPIVIISILLILFSIVFPIIVSVGNPLFPDRPPAGSGADGDTGGSTEENSIPLSEKDSGISVNVSIDGAVTTMGMDEYLAGVLSAEMPASFEPEALKAQAVAARTYTLYKMLVKPSPNHPEADVCTDSSCCKAYADEETLRAKWGGDYEANRNKIVSAVNSTDGVYLSYEAQPILAAFHSSSSGKTEASQTVWSTYVPYLQIVDSPETEAEVPNYVVTVQVALDDFRETVHAQFPEAVLDGDPAGWITDVKLTDSGRVDTLKVGGVTIPGVTLRAMFDLRSTHIAVSFADNAVVFTTTGYGHGVGMSQYGANILAKQGHGYLEILAWYYPGTSPDSTANLSLTA